VNAFNDPNVCVFFPRRCAEGYKGQRCETKDVPNSGSLNSYFCIFGSSNSPQYPC